MRSRLAVLGLLAIVGGSAVAISVAVGGRAGIEVPEAKKDFVARWASEADYFAISSDGTVSLEINGSSETLSITGGSIASFSDRRICVNSVWPYEADCFEISAAPYSVDGVWAIRVEGVELRRRFATPTADGSTVP